MDKSEIPAVGEGKRGTDGHIAYLLRQASAAVRQRLEQGFAAHNITLPQFTLLTMLKAYPGLSGAELARLAMLTPQTVNVITANLLKRGAIARVRSGEDKRIFVLSLTGQGARDLAACRSIADGVEQQLLAGTSAADEAAIRRWLVSVAAVGQGAE
ncbi:MAG: MarR family transcriptional regulator [Parasphingorhabdus sp.]